MLPGRLLASAAVVVAGALLAGCSSSPEGTSSESPTPSDSTSSAAPAPTDSAGASLAAFYGQKLAWTGCGGDFQCAKLRVPLDYAAPTGASIQLALIRLRTASDKRIGSLILNPGGPGGSGVDYARAARAVVDESVRARYDVVGFDPRGVARSSPVECLDDKQTDTFLAADGTPRRPRRRWRQIEKLWPRSSRSGLQARGRRRSYAHIEHARSAVRDMDILRAALGDEKLTWLGFSYGTMLGATYADLFPTRVGRMVLDGAIDPDAHQRRAHRTARRRASRSRSTTSCSGLRSSSSDCPLPRGEQAGHRPHPGVHQTTLDSAPQTRPSDPKRPLTQALADECRSLSYLYFPAYGDWDQLLIRVDLQASFDGDGSHVLLSMIDERTSAATRRATTPTTSNVGALRRQRSRPSRPPDGRAVAGARRPVVEGGARLRRVHSRGGSCRTSTGTCPGHRPAARRSPPPARRRSWSWARRTTPPLPIRGRSRSPSSSRRACSSPGWARVTPAYGKGSQCTDSAIDRYLRHRRHARPPARSATDPGGSGRDPRLRVTRRSYAGSGGPLRLGYPHAPCPALGLTYAALAQSVRATHS